MVGIYKITNELNGHVYIGQSTNINKRWNKHKTSPFNQNSIGYNSFFYRAIRKYGIEYFSFAVIELCSKEELNAKEMYWIKFYNSNNPDNGYNLTLGGYSGTPLVLSLEEVEEIKILLKTTNLSQEHISQNFNISQKMVSAINIGENWYSDEETYPLRQKNSEKCECGNKVAKGNKSGKCVRCANLAKRVVDRPDADTLKKEIQDSNFSAVGRKYGVSDTAIKKWCKSYGMSTFAKDYK